MGFVRDMLMARAFGAGIAADAFFVAYRIPNFLRSLLAEGAFAQAFVPVFNEYKTRRGHAELRQLTDYVAGMLGAVVFGITLIGVILAPILVLGFAPGFLDDPERYDLTVVMLQIMFPYLLFMSLAALAGGILNSYGQFGVPAFTSILLNLAMMGAILFLAPHFEHPIVALAWGVFIGGLLQLLSQLPFLYRLRLLPRPRLNRKDEGVRRIMKLMLPAIFGVSVTQINMLVNTLMASFLVIGSVSWLYYSVRLVTFPLGVFGIALATVILPSLSQKHSRLAPEEFSHTLDWAMRWVAVISIPATVGLVLLAGPLFATLFQYGEFSARDVHMSAMSLMTYSLALPAFFFVKVLAPGFYARQDTATPVRIGVIAVLVNLVSSVILVFPLAHAGLALGTAIGAFVNCALLYHGLRKLNVYQPRQGWRALGLRILVANVLMGAVLWIGAGDLSTWLGWDATTRAMHLLGLVAAGALVYLATLWISGLRPKALLMKTES